MSAAPRTARYERRDVRPRYVIYATVTLFGGTALSVALVVGLLQLFQAQLPRSPGASPAVRQVERGGPKLELKEGEDRPAIEAAANAKLHGYAWTDRAGGTVRVPIERAMDLLARQGWPDKDRKGPK